MKVIAGRFILSALLLCGLWAAAHAAVVLPLVKERSQIEFVGTKPGGSHRGGFKRFTAEAVADWDDLSKSSVKIDIDATSLWSDNNGLTGHLQNADFFDVPRYPHIRFETSRIELKSASQAIVTGTLTMLGKAVEVSIPCNVDVADGGLVVKSEFKIDRTRWGMTGARGRVDDEVEITVKLVFGR